MAKYNVIGVKREIEENGEKKTVFDPVELISQAGMAKGKAFNWDPGSQVTELQVSDEQAKQLVESGVLEVVEPPASWAEKKPE